MPRCDRVGENGKDEPAAIRTGIIVLWITLWLCAPFDKAYACQGIGVFFFVVDSSGSLVLRHH